MRDFDAIAVGGGLAGAAFALELARHGARVAIIERTATPTLKVCGDFLSREAQELLSYLGIGMAALGAPRASKLRLATGKQVATAALPFSGAGLSRLRLDEELLDQARAAGVEIIRGGSVTALAHDAQGVRVALGDKALRAPTVALATGKHNLRGLPRGAGSSTAYKIQLSLSAPAVRDLQDVVQLASYRGGYMGACHVEDDSSTICWLMDRPTMREVGPDWRMHLNWIARSCGAVGDLISGARFHSERPAAVSAIPYGYMRRAVIAPDIYPLGDQLCVIPSCTGDGTSLALSSGIAAAQAVLGGLSAGQFQAAFLERVRRQFRWARLIEATFNSAPLRSLAVGTVAAWPALAGLAANVTRVKGVGELMPAPTAAPTAARAR
jgi:flavin-dependent dehydrogenase